MGKVFQSRFQEEYEVLAQIGKGNYARVNIQIYNLKYLYQNKPLIKSQFTIMHLNIVKEE